MEQENGTISIPGELVPAAMDEIGMSAAYIYDYTLNKFQNKLNEEASEVSKKFIDRDDRTMYNLNNVVHVRVNNGIVFCGTGYPENNWKLLVSEGLNVPTDYYMVNPQNPQDSINNLVTKLLEGFITGTTSADVVILHFDLDDIFLPSLNLQIPEGSYTGGQYVEGPIGALGYKALTTNYYESHSFLTDVKTPVLTDENLEKRRIQFTFDYIIKKLLELGKLVMFLDFANHSNSGYSSSSRKLAERFNLSYLFINSLEPWRIAESILNAINITSVENKMLILTDRIGKGGARTFGANNTVKGNYASAYGFGNTVEGSYSSAEGRLNSIIKNPDRPDDDRKLEYCSVSGYNNHIYSRYGFAHGRELTINNPYETAFGICNDSHVPDTSKGEGPTEYTVFSVGIGRSNNDGTTTYANAFEVRLNGDIYILLKGQGNSFEQVNLLEYLNKIGASVEDITTPVLPTPIPPVVDPEESDSDDGNGVYKCSLLLNNGETKLIYGQNTSLTSNEIDLYRDKIVKVTFNPGLERVEAETFANCPLLEEVVFYSSPSFIGRDAFDNCQELSKVTTRSIVSWCKLRFENEKSNPVYYAGNLWLEGNQVTSLEVPSFVLEIKPYTFNYCSSLEEIIILNGNTHIGKYAFANCSNISYINLPNSIEYIGEGAFKGCNNLEEINIPATTIGKKAFLDCYRLYEVELPEGLTTLNDGLFQDCYELTNISIPDSVTTIGNDVFSGCINLRNVNVGNNVTTIGEYVFSDCVKLESVTLPTTLTSIDSRAFNNCTELTEVHCYATTVPTLEGNVFRNVDIANATLYVSDYIVSDYENTAIWQDFGTITAIEVEYITFEDPEVERICLENWDTNQTGKLSKREAANITDIGTIFLSNQDITSFNELLYFTGITSLPESAFEFCTSLTSITIPNAVTNVDKHAFYGCSGLTSVTIPEGVTSIGNSAFWGCSSLTSITIPESVTSIGKYVFQHCSNLTSITISNNITDINDFAFASCSSLTTVNTSENVIGISSYAFSNCTSLTSVTIGSNVRAIGNYAFKGCSSLTEVYCHAESVPSANLNVYEDTPISSATLYVPASAVSAYQANSNWGRFGTIEAIS